MSLEVRELNYIYGKDSSREVRALHDISFTIHDGEFVGIIGCTGSGKSTLIQHLNGLEKATSGDVLYNGKSIYDKDFSMKELRSHVGLVFQYPEYQLFDETVLKDVTFGPKNLGLSEKECTVRAREALALVGMEEEYYEVSPYDLSGGQKRRAAIAGVLAMKPDILILDEPTAGLDPAGRTALLNMLRDLHEKIGITVILVSHSMEDVGEYVERLLVMYQGTLQYDGSTKEVFRHYRELEEISLAVPQVTYLMHVLKEQGFEVDPEVTKISEALQTLKEVV